MFTFREMLKKYYKDRPGRSRKNRTVTSPPHTLLLSLLMTVMTAPTPSPPPTPALIMWTMEHTPGVTGVTDGTLTTPSSRDPDAGGGDRSPSLRMMSKSSPPGLLRLPEDGYKRKRI